ncbi:MAG: DUF4838 domain-containing protein [Chthoniobacterales bacterium]|nr:DUF4838 domain-containing protein [Chthoniobacterales bacterium]
MKPIVLALLLGLVSGVRAAESEPFPVVPGAAYRLSFEAEGGNDEARWTVHLRDADGNLPFDGVLEGDWQRIEPGRKTHTQLFRAPAGVATCRLIIRDPGVTLGKVTLEKEAAAPLLLNGDFSEGPGNYSGWTERYNAELVEKDGQTLLRVNQNGYALTDYAPVVGGEHYVLKSTQGIPGARVLAYDAQRRFLGIVEREKPGAPFETPKDAAWLRVIYATGHHHLPAWRVNEIVKAELLPEDVPAESVPVAVENDKDWEIVLVPGSDPREEFAARELRHWMTAITGKAPALLAEPSTGGIRKIFVGRAGAEGFPEDLKTLAGSDGYAVRSKGGNIHVFGAHPRGTYYGALALLERNSDIIWPRPNREFAAIFSRAPKLDFTDADFLSRPVFRDRYVSGSDDLAFYQWQGRNGLNTPWHLHKGNNYLAWLNAAQLGYSGSYMFWLGDARETDEKVLPLIDGKRVNNVWRQPCYTYPGTVDAIVATFRRLLGTLPGREIEYFHATLADNWTVCGCPVCMASIKLPDGKTLTAQSSDATKEPLFFSTRNFQMLNKVAEALSKDYPDLQIRSHAYIFTAEPPAVPLHPAIIPEYAAYPTQNLRYPILSGTGKKISLYDEGIWKRRFEEWGKAKPGALGYFGYYYPDGLNAVADTAAEDFRALAGFGGVQVHTESFPADDEKLSSWDGDGIEKWVITKLMWDPARDPEALRKDYIRRVYHGAEKEMTAYYKLIRDAWHQAPKDVFVNCHSPASELFRDLVVTPGIEERAKQLLADAAKAATHPQSQALIQRQRAYFDKLAGTLGRVAVPYVEESANEWLEASSPHWEKAAVVEGFRKVDDWRLFDKAESAHPTRVRAMHDRKNLYLRFDGADAHPAGQVKPPVPAGPVFPNGDRFEMRLRNAKNRDAYLALGPGGHYYSFPPIGNRWKTVVTGDEKSWTALVAIPLNLLGPTEADQQAFKVRLGRVVRLRGEEREESTPNGAGLFNEHGPLWLDFQLQ